MWLAAGFVARRGPSRTQAVPGPRRQLGYENVLRRVPRPPFGAPRCDRACLRGALLVGQEWAKDIQRDRPLAGVEQQKVRKLARVLRFIAQRFQERPLLRDKLVDDVLFVGMVERYPLRAGHHQRERFDLVEVLAFGVEEARHDELDQACAPRLQFGSNARLVRSPALWSRKKAQSGKCLKNTS